MGLLLFKKPYNSLGKHTLFLKDTIPRNSKTTSSTKFPVFQNLKLLDYSNSTKGKNGNSEANLWSVPLHFGKVNYENTQSAAWSTFTLTCVNVDHAVDCVFVKLYNSQELPTSWKYCCVHPIKGSKLTNEILFIFTLLQSGTKER